jgi:hypothetical protein
MIYIYLFNQLTILVASTNSVGLRRVGKYNDRLIRRSIDSMDRAPRTWLLIFFDILSDFVRQGLRCTRYDFWKETNCPRINSLSSRGDDPHRARITPPLAPMITYADFFVKSKNGSNRRFWNSRPGGNHSFVDTSYVPSGRWDDSYTTLEDRERRLETRSVSSLAT